jgi:Tfp pilus assembly protein PilO
MKLTKIQQYVLIAAVVILAVIFGYYQFILKPLNADIAFLQSDLEEKQKKLDSAKQMVAKYDEFKKRSAATLRELEWAQSRMPLQLDRSKFIESVSLLQARTGISFTNFKFQTNGVAKDSFTEVPASVTFSSNFAQFLNFLYEASISKNLMIMHDIKILPFTDPVPNSKSTLTVQMVLSGIQGKKQ